MAKNQVKLKSSNQDPTLRMQEDQLVREVNEEVQQEELAQTLAKYKKPLIGFVILVLLATAGFEAHKAWKLNTRLAESDTYERAAVLNAQGNADAAIQLYSELQDGRTGYKYLAAMRIADIQFEQGQAADGINTLSALRQDRSMPPELRAIVTLALVGRQVDTAPSADLQEMLNPYMMVNNPWYGSASELSALLLIKDGKADVAQKLLQEALKMPSVPMSVRERLEALLSVLKK